MLDDLVRLALAWGVLYAGLFGAVGFTLVLLIGGGSMIDFTTEEASVREAARVYLPWAAMIPIIGIWCYQLDGIFIGATGTRQMRNMAIVSVAGYLAVWAVLTPAFANQGLWASILIFLALRAVTLGACLPALAREKFAAPEVAVPPGRKRVFDTRRLGEG